MLRGTHLVKSTAAVIGPSLLFALLIFQVYRCKNILVLRNSYLLETLPSRSNWIWDATAGTATLGLSITTNNDPSSGSRKLVVNGSQDASNIQTSFKKSVVEGNLQTYHSAVLLPGMPTLTVHYLWCIDGHFEIAHYISILSIIFQLRPDKIIIHHRSKPRSDPQGYWRWLEDLQQNIVMLSLRPLANPRYCSHDFSAGVAHDTYDFHDPYGVFLMDDILISNLTREYVLELMIKSFSKQETDYQFKKNQLPNTSEKELGGSQVFLVAKTEPYHLSQKPGRSVITCPPMTEKQAMRRTENSHCFSINAEVKIEHLFTRDTNFHRYARSIMYGSPEPIQVKMAPTMQIPNIVHIVLVNGEITPLVYASIKSAYVKGHAEQVFVHGPEPPTGELWRNLLNFHDDLKPKYIPTFSLKQSRHAAIRYALYTLLLHGGIAHFGDVIFLRPISTSSRCAGAIAILHFSHFRLRHRSTNTAILGGAKGSQFIETMLAMTREDNQPWRETRADDIATHVGEMYPTSVLLDFKLVTHQNCQNNHCEIAGGHEYPYEFYTTRLIWNEGAPKTLEQFKSIEGPSRNEILDIINS